jgi:hypothetical protein
MKASMNAPTPPAAPTPDDYPTALDGGEPQHHDDHRVGETQRQGPRSDDVDPSANEARPDKAGREEDESGDAESAA